MIRRREEDLGGLAMEMGGREPLRTSTMGLGQDARHLIWGGGGEVGRFNGGRGVIETGSSTGTSLGWAFRHFVRGGGGEVSAIGRSWSSSS